MKTSVVSKVGSILISTTLVILFAIVQAPLQKPVQADTAGVVVRKAIPDIHGKKKLIVTAGKSMIVDSKVGIVRASVGDPQLAEAVTLDSHELLVNAKLAGETTLTLWQQDGGKREFSLSVAARNAEDARLDVSSANTGQRLLAAFHGETGGWRNPFSGEAK